MINLCASTNEIKDLIARSFKTRPVSVVRTNSFMRINRGLSNNQSFTQEWFFGYDNFSELPGPTQKPGDTLFYGNLKGSIANISSYADNYNLLIAAQYPEFLAIPPPAGPIWTTRGAVIFARGSVGGVGVNYFCEKPFTQGESLQIPDSTGVISGLFTGVRLDVNTDATGLIGIDGFIYFDGYQVNFR